MGNRAVITTTNALRENGSLKKNEIGIYLHWCGSPENVQRFLGEDFGGYELSIGIDRLERLDCANYDNGVYIFKDWTIVKQIDSADVKLR